MTIDPTQITTKSAEELPVLALTNDSIIVHSVGGVLYQATVSEIQALLNIVSYKPYEVKQLNVTDLYIETNFEVNGLGKEDGLWPGWAIINGNNGTVINQDNATFVGWGTTNNAMRAQVGENTKTLVKNNIPPLDVALDNSVADNGDPGVYLISANTQLDQKRTYTNAVNSASTTASFSIQQKSFVQLFIMKLP